MRNWLRFLLVGRLLFIAMLSCGLLAGAAPTSPALFGPAPALADDDDDDDDDSGSASSRSGGSGGPVTYGRGANPFRPFFRNFWRAPQRRAAPRARRPAPPPPVQAPREIVAAGLDQAQLDGLVADGFAVLDQDDLPTLGSLAVRLRAPANLPMQAALARVRTSAPGAAADLNHLFRPNQAACDGRLCAVELIGWPAANRPASCGSGATIGLIDTAINPQHPAFAGRRFEAIRLSDGELPASGKQHGTAIAALLVGAPESSTPGLLPEARLIAVDAFHRGAGQDDRADAYDLARALDLLAGRNVDVINMSLAGPANAVVQRLVRDAAARDIVLVAAAGNQGPRAQPIYPAAFDEVIAVTAIDRFKRPYRRAGQGDHIDLAAPGVDVWTAASIKGARPKTGTSFAAPFVAAAAAIARSSGTASAKSIHEQLAASAEDLGDPGKDRVFGWGLLKAGGICTTGG